LGKPVDTIEEIITYQIAEPEDKLPSEEEI